MYTEYKIIIACLGVIIILHTIQLAVMIMMLKRSNMNVSSHTSKRGNNGSIVFCRKCAAQYDASQKCCPECGTPR